ncbi:MAG: AAA family ATPase [Planctomycetes bacterium]|nr:AAA family ATPase [Planctomycetota bacterium]
MKVKELKASELRWQCPASWVPTRKANANCSIAQRLFGQERALDAIQMGLNVNSPGYNIFVCGVGGTDKAEVMQELLECLDFDPGDLFDHVFVHNFHEPMNPQHLELPLGSGIQLMTGMRNWVHALRTEIPKLLKSEEHLERRHHLFARYQKAESQLFRRFEAKLQKSSLALVAIEEDNGTRKDIHLRINDKVCSPEQALQLPTKQRPSATKLKKMFGARASFLPQVEQTQNKARAMALRLIREANSIDEQVMTEAVQGITIALAEDLQAEMNLASWLGDCAQFALNHSQMWTRSSSNADAEEAVDQRGLEVFEVNPVRSLRENKAPIVFEPHPNYSNLFGTIERAQSQQGVGYVHHAVRPGSLLRADGGILVLNARDVFREAEVWRSLKRTLQSGQLSIHALESLSPLGITGARPQAVPIKLKVVLVGDSNLYDHLHDEEPDFSRIFKVKSEFEDSLPLMKKHAVSMANSLHHIGQQENLLPIANTGMRALLERAVNDAGGRKRISTRLPILADYLRESSFYAAKNGRKSIQRKDVYTARNHYRDQHAIDAEWHERQVLEGIYKIKTKGTEVGAINAMTVVGLGPLSFGRPARISAMATAGDESYNNIDSEVNLTGNIHNKGMLALENYMRCQFGRKKALPAKMSLCFDQNYGPIDGDSASTTELYALLSALSGFPIRQDIAVTGALAIDGEITAIGGVNDKIDGFFRICKQRKLTGKQGVLIPDINAKDLMLNQNVIDEVKASRFHIYTAKNVRAGIELLTGKRWQDVYAAVAKRLEEFDPEDKKKG